MQEDIINLDQLDQLDDRYFEVNQAWMEALNSYFREWITRGEDPLVHLSPKDDAPLTKREVKPCLRLIGHDGNAFAIMGRAINALRRAGCSNETITAYRMEAASGDYDHLLATTMKYCDVQ